MNLERDGAPDVPTVPSECGCCRHFSAIGEGGSGFCQKGYEYWLEGVYNIGCAPTGDSTIEWLRKNAIEEGDDACSLFEEYG